MFSIVSYDTIYNTLVKFSETKKENNMILEPFCCLIKLALLNFYPPGTKLNIHENSLSFHEPTLYQGMLRFFYKQGREDLHNLYNPLVKSIEWYTHYNSSIDIIFELAIEGLKKLLSTYPENCTIKHTINYYISTLKKRNKKESKERINKLPKQDDDTILLYIKDLWTSGEVNIVIQHLQELHRLKSFSKDIDQNDIECHLKSLFTLTEYKEHKLHSFLESYVSVL